MNVARAQLTQIVMLKNLIPLGANSVVADMEPVYSVFKGAFGGWTAAHAYEAGQLLKAPDAEPISLTIDFIKGIPPGSVRSIAHPLSVGKSAQFIRVETFSGEVLVANTSVVFAKRRQTPLIESVEKPLCREPESIGEFVFPANELVGWPTQFHMRFVHGNLMQRSPELRSQVWIKFKDPQRPFDFQCLTALMDANFPRIFFYFNQTSPIATVSMTVQFHADAAELAQINHDFVLMDAHGSRASHGFFDQTVRMWSRNGKLLASSVQMVRYSESAGGTLS